VPKNPRKLKYENDMTRDDVIITLFLKPLKGSKVQYLKVSSLLINILSLTSPRGCIERRLKGIPKYK
jgi:hypothetical protein